MIEIKFRAWDKVMTKKFEMSKPFNPFYYGGVFTANCVFMQFTGVHDAAKKEVFDGDIIGSAGFFNKVIVWHKNGFYTYSVNNHERLFPLNLDEHDFIIGNIYENPELLK